MTNIEKIIWTKIYPVSLLFSVSGRSVGPSNRRIRSWSVPSSSPIVLSHHYWYHNMHGIFASSTECSDLNRGKWEKTHKMKPIMCISQRQTLCNQNQDVGAEPTSYCTWYSKSLKAVLSSGYRVQVTKVCPGPHSKSGHSGYRYLCNILTYRVSDCHHSYSWKWCQSSLRYRTRNLTNMQLWKGQFSN